MEYTDLLKVLIMRGICTYRSWWKRQTIIDFCKLIVTVADLNWCWQYSETGLHELDAPTYMCVAIQITRVLERWIIPVSKYRGTTTDHSLLHSASKMFQYENRNFSKTTRPIKKYKAVHDDSALNLEIYAISLICTEMVKTEIRSTMKSTDWEKLYRPGQ